LRAFRCSDASLERAEPAYGTASTVRAFLLIECAGPWGVMALRDGRLPRDVTSPLVQTARASGVRPLLIRRHHRQAARGLAVFAASAHPTKPWMETAQLDAPAQLLDLDLAAFGQGESVGLTPTDSPLFLVCTHGKHDACCAEKGRPIATALTAAEPDATWEVSHIGGDRFAGNVLVLRDGLYYGRLDATSAVAMAARHRAGQMDLEHLRGRSGYPFAVQTAEWFLRRELNLDGLRDLSLSARKSRGDVVDVDFHVHDGRSYRISVRQSRSAPQRLTCTATVESPIPSFELADLVRTDA
jgi:hypothetical protein